MLNILQGARKNAEVLHMIYLKFMCNTSAFFLAPCKIFNMQVAHLYLLDFITDATVDLLTNNLKPEGDFFIVSIKKGLIGIQQEFI
jgi:hypothetical protein